MAKTGSPRGFGLLALGCGLLAPAGAQLVQTGSLNGTGLTGGSLAGFSSAISSDGKTAIAGAPGYSADAGGAWVHTRSGVTWDGNGTRLAAGTGGSGAAQQGYAVAISGDGLTIMVGGPADAAGGAGAGAVWFYAGSGESFSQQGAIWNGAAGSSLGTSVALSSDGNTAIAGGPGGNSAIVYVRAGTSWSAQATLTAAGSSSLGTAVALSADGNTALVGAPNSNSSVGGAWIFTRSGSSWGAGTQLPLGTPAISSGRQGMSVSLSANGQTALVGGYNTALLGSSWIFVLSNGVWAQEANLSGSPATATAAQGAAVAISGDGNTALVGGFDDNSMAGTYWGFSRTVNQSTQAVTWSQKELSGGASGWQCGHSVAVSADGNEGLVGCSGFPSTGFTATVGAPDLTITKTHNGAFSRGASGSYTIVVTNSGSASTGGVATVTDPLPAGLTYSTFSGSGWSCATSTANSVTTVTCTNGTVVAAGSAYPNLTLTVNVSSSAPTAVPNTATVSGGGETNISNDTATDLVTLPALADLAITKSHSGALYRGRVGVPYALTVINVAASGSTSGTVTVTDNLPVGLTNAGNIVVPSGWSCTGGASLNCSTSNSLSAGTAYRVTFTANVSSNSPSTITNIATVAGGGEINAANDSASDTAAVGANGPDLTISLQDSGLLRVGQSATYWITVSNAGAASTSGSVLVTNTLPAGVTATSMSGIGWTCTVGTLSCTRHDVLPAGLSYRVIALKVNVLSPSGSTATDTASVSGGGDSNLANNTASDTTAVLH